MSWTHDRLETVLLARAAMHVSAKMKGIGA
jgi:hypothetical protein